MNILHRFYAIRKDLDTMKRLSFSQKLGFLFDYYRGRFFLLLCLCLAGFYIWDAACQASRQTVLEGFFTNDDLNQFPAQDIAEDFSKTLGLTSRQQVIFDDSLYVVRGSSVDYHTASQSKIVAYVAAKELDFLVTTRELAEYYSASLPVYDLEELLPEKLFDTLEGQMYYGTDASGTAKACAVSLAGSRFQPGGAPAGSRSGSADEAAASSISKAAQKGEAEASHYLMVFSYTEHADTVIDFLRYAFPQLP